MYYFTIKSKIESFARFKPVFDSDESRRLGLGIKVVAIMKEMDDENNITILMSASDLKSIEDRKTDEIVKQKMAEAGVLGKPEWKIYKS